MLPYMRKSLAFLHVLRQTICRKTGIRWGATTFERSFSLDRKIALQLRNQEPWRETAKEMAEAGFEYVAFAFGDERPLLKDNWRAYVGDVADAFAGLGLKCVQTHAPYYDLLISAEKRDEGMETALIRSVEATRILGAEICAVHPRSFITEGAPRETAVDRGRSLTENLVSFRPLVAECERRNVLLGIENLMKYPFAHPYFYSWIADDHAELIDRLESENVCAVWDFGHANLVDDDHAERIRKLGHRIKGTHVHNNAGREDEHFPPFLPEPNSYYVRRSVDWRATLAALKSTGFDGFLTLETVFNYAYPMNGYVKYLHESTEVLYDILANT